MERRRYSMEEAESLGAFVEDAVTEAVALDAEVFGERVNQNLAFPTRSEVT
ncbi:hypothetical protein [Burkholderia sp. L27(2015)]|uniref:hypothetical protein n=1 Tax=Burkholderia sp. L27(2015) TaxID=1641858 RepID=UPI00131D08EE|nr:hypothetical protein [Burkholderia sp. L27(2015)]